MTDLANFTVTVDSIGDLWLVCDLCDTDIAGGSRKLSEFVAIAEAHECRASGETPAE